MQAIFKGILFNAEKYDDLPGYKLSKGKNLYGSIWLDSKRFVVCFDAFDKEGTLAFDIDLSDFKLLDYNIVTLEWIKELMEVKQLDVHNIAEIAGVSDSTIYRILEGKEISGSIKSSLFNFFNK